MAGRWMLAAMAAFLFVAAGCERGPEKRKLEFDPHYSINVMMVPSFWPREDYDWPKDPVEKMAQQEAYAKHGRPDYIRMIYTFDNRIVRSHELDKTHVLASRRPVPLTQWVYLERDLAITFQGPEAVESPVPDPVRIVCKYGDPNDIKEFAKPDYHQTSFYFNSHGLEVIFVDGRLQREKRLSDPVSGQIDLR